METVFAVQASVALTDGKLGVTPLHVTYVVLTLLAVMLPLPLPVVLPVPLPLPVEEVARVEDTVP